MRKLHLVLFLLLGFVLVAGACAPKASSPSATPPAAKPASSAPAPSIAPAMSEWDKVLEAARKEGTMTLYSTWGVQAAEVLKAEMAKYGIKVESIGAPSPGELELKVMNEQRAKAYVDDVFVGGWTNQLNLLNAGYAYSVTSTLPALAEKNVWKNHPGKYDSTNSIFAFGTSLTPSVLANTDLVRPGEITSWNDLLDSRWRDRMVMNDPRTGSGPGASGLGAWTILGEDFWKKMAAQRITLQASYGVQIDQLVHGEKSVGLFPSYSRTVAAIRAGAPLKIVNLKEGTSIYVNAVMVVKNAPHPNASLVFLNWLLTKEGQIVMGKVLENSSMRTDVVEDWWKIAELRPGAYTVLEPPNNLDLETPKKGVDLATKLFGAR
ncbi:MAG: putative binding protein component of iron transporter precursor [Dehalococcoidia bacterium]|nr:putative binding protein component of iron transporter precursor [Dehalococcoidia bacterium]